MTELFVPRQAAGPPAPAPRLGQAVHVNARTAWLPATITSIMHSRVGVAYDTGPQVSSPLATVVAPWVVRPADGIRLQPAPLLRSGDDVVAFDGTMLTVAVVWQGRDRWWVIDYTNGERATVPPHTILRLTDPTPAVSVNGIPL